MRTIWVVVISIVATVVIVLGLVAFTGVKVVDSSKVYVEENYSDDIAAKEKMLGSLVTVLKEGFAEVIYGLLHIEAFRHWLVTSVESGLLTADFLDQFLVDDVIPIIDKKWASVGEAVRGSEGFALKSYELNAGINSLKGALNKIPIDKIKENLPKIGDLLDSLEGMDLSGKIEAINDLLDQLAVCTEDTDNDGNFIWGHGQVFFDSKGDGNPTNDEVWIDFLNVGFEADACQAPDMTVIKDKLLNTGVAAEELYWVLEATDIFTPRP